MRIDQVNVSPIEGLVRELWDRGGTDIHIAAGTPPMFRIDGELVPAEGYKPLQPDEIEQLTTAMLPEGLQERFITEHQVDFSFSWKDVTRYRGRAIRISFTGTQNQGPPTYFMLDDVGLNIWR